MNHLHVSQPKVSHSAYDDDSGRPNTYFNDSTIVWFSWIDSNWSYPMPPVTKLNATASKHAPSARKNIMPGVCQSPLFKPPTSLMFRMKLIPLIMK